MQPPPSEILLEGFPPLERAWSPILQAVGEGARHGYGIRDSVEEDADAEVGLGGRGARWEPWGEASSTRGAGSKGIDSEDSEGALDRREFDRAPGSGR